MVGSGAKEDPYRAPFPPPNLQQMMGAIPQDHLERMQKRMEEMEQATARVEEALPKAARTARGTVESLISKLMKAGESTPSEWAGVSKEVRHLVQMRLELDMLVAGLPYQQAMATIQSMRGRGDE